MAVCWHIVVKLRLPIGQQAHLAAIVAMTKARQPGAFMWRSNRDNECTLASPLWIFIQALAARPPML